MGAFENLFRRLGYAKLEKYGLVLTGDDRVLTNRPHILDDGLGGKIVGWADDDLAAMELEHWGQPKAKPEPAKRVAGKKVIQPPPRPPQRATVQTPVIAAAPAPAVVVAPVAVAPVAVAPVVVAAPPAPVVAPEEPVEDDDWEWVIAIARARAAAEEEAPKPVRRMPAPVPAMKPVVHEPPPLLAPPTVRRTVIPVPSLGESPLRRIARGTGQLDDTVRTLPAPPANDDTSPYVTLPSEVKPVGLAHTKRVAAKAR